MMKTLEYAEGLEHIMEFTRRRALNSLFSMIHQLIRDVLQYNQNHPDFPMEVGALVFLSAKLLCCSHLVGSASVVGPDGTVCQP